MYPVNFDRTDVTRQSLDNYITDDSIVQLVQHTFRHKEKSFYRSFPEARDAVFVPPYPPMACRELGYPETKVDHDDKLDEKIRRFPNIKMEKGDAGSNKHGRTLDDPITLLQSDSEQEESEPSKEDEPSHSTDASSEDEDDENLTDTKETKEV